MKQEKVYIFVTNDLNQDQRMHKVADFLYRTGYSVTLVGRMKKNSPMTLVKAYNQHRFPCLFQKGPMFYLEFNIRMLVFLLRKSKGIVYSVDLDTLLGATFAWLLKKAPLIFDAHEWFTETPELENRNWVKKIWSIIGLWGISKAHLHLTVNQSLADIFSEQYKVTFTPIYNVPALEKFLPDSKPVDRPFRLVYQGMLNKGRGLEELILAMPALPEAELYIVGEGDLSKDLRSLAAKSVAAKRIFFTGWLFGEDLATMTRNAHLGLNLLVAGSKSYYYSLANKFFDYMYAGTPSLNMAYPEYEQILERYPVGKTISHLSPEDISRAILTIMKNPEIYQNMKKTCFQAVQEYQWEKEEEKLRQALVCSGLL